MKVILAFVAILGLAIAGPIADDLSDIKEILACFHKALADGIPSVGIPAHDPLQVSAFNYGNKPDFFFGLDNTTLEGLLNYNFTTLDVAKKSSHPDTVLYDYAIHWPQLTLSGNWEFDTSSWTLWGTTYSRSSGNYKYVLEDLTWSGTFNLTKSGQEGYRTKVNDFTVTSAVKRVSAKITGEEPFDRILNVITSALIDDLLNDFPTILADLLNKILFNGYWIGHPDRTQAVFDHCGLSN